MRTLSLLTSFVVSALAGLSLAQTAPSQGSAGVPPVSAQPSTPANRDTGSLPVSSQPRPAANDSQRAGSPSHVDAPDPSKVPVRERERTIYVPYTELEQVFTDGGKGVFLPYREFLAMWNELTLKREAEEKPVPVDVVISRGDYTGRVEGQTLVLDAKISVESFKKGWQTLHLCGPSSVGFAEVQTGKAVLESRSNGYDLLLPDKGQYDITLKLMLPITLAAGKSKVTLALPYAAVSKLVMNVPGEGLEFEVKPSAAFTTRPLGAQTELSAFFGGSSFFGGTDKVPELSWGAPQGVTQMTPLLLSEVRLGTAIKAGTMTTSARFDLRILRAPMAEFKVTLPAGQELLGVTGDNIKTWNVAAAANGKQQLTVTPDKPVKDAYNFVLALEGAVPALPTEVKLPEFTVEGASYARGEALVSTEQQFDVTPKTLEAVVRASTQVEVKDGLMSVGNFRLLKQPYSLSMTVEEAKPQVEVTSSTRLEVLRNEAKIEAELTYDVKRVGIFETRIVLPSGINVTSVKGPNVLEWKVEGTAPAAQTLLVKLKAQTKGEFTLNLIGKQLRAQPTEDSTLPLFAPQNVARHEGKIGVGVHSSLEASTKALGDAALEDVSELKTMGFGGRGANGAALDPFAMPAVTSGGNGFTNATTELSLAFRYRDAAKPAVLAFKSRDPQVSAEVMTLVDAKEQSTRHQWTLSFDVAYAAVDKVVIAVPKAVANDVRFDAASLAMIKETKKTGIVADAAMTKALADIASYELWEVTLRSERLGGFNLGLSHEKQGALEAGKTGKVEMLQLHVPAAFQEIGQVALTKDNSLELRNEQVEGLEEIDARELRGQLQRGGIVHAYKYRALPIKLSVETAKNAYFAVPRAVITHAVLTTAVATDMAQSTEAIYWVRNIDMQFLVVQLPKGAKLVSDIFVGKDPQQPMQREGSADLLVRLPSGSGGASQQSAFPVRFVYEVPSLKPGEIMGSWGSITIAPPTVTEVKVFETRHDLYLPDAYHYTRFAGPLQQSLSDRGWGRVRHLIDPLIPAFGPQLDRAGQTLWSNPPAIPNDIRSLYDFQVPTQGRQETLRRLGAPAAMEVSFRSRSMSYLFESIAFLITLAAGLWFSRSELRVKAVFIVMTGAVAVLATGVLGPVNSLIATSVMLALMAIMGLWAVMWLKGIVWGAGAKISRWRGGKGNSGGPPVSAPPTPPRPSAPARPAPTNPAPDIDSTSSGSTTTGSSAPVQMHDVPSIQDDDAQA